MSKKPTLKDLKSKGRWKARSKMTAEELDYFIEYIDKKRSETIMLEEMLDTQNKLSKPGVIVGPMYLPVRRKQTPDKKMPINLNAYRNWDFITSNDLKVRYKELMKKYISHLGPLKNIHVDYVIYYGICEPDATNIGSIQSKFFLDALQEYGYLENDNLSNVTESYLNGGREKGNERIEIIITQK